MQATNLGDVYAFVAFLYLVAPLITWLILWRVRTAGVNLWCMGSLLLAIGLFVAALREVLPSYPVLSIANALMFIAIVLRIQALLDFVGKKQRIWIWLVVGTLYLGAYELMVVRHIEPLGLLLAVQSIMLIRTGYICLLIAKQPNGRSIQWSGYAYIAMAMGMLAMLGAILTQQVPPDYLAINPYTIAMLLLGVTSSLTGHLGIVGLILERTRAQESIALIAQAKAEANLKLGDQIAQLQRHHVVGEMAGLLSHELSQPLAAALFSTQTVSRQLADTEQPLSHEDLNSNVQRIQRALRNANDVVLRIRNFIKPNAELGFVPIDCGQLIEEIIDISRALAEKKSVAIISVPSTFRCMSMGDKVQISQVLLNLISNAVEAAAQNTRAQPEVRISVKHRHKHIEILITDNGPGFDPQNLAKVGEAFYTTKPNGLGLGLSIARQIVERHQGIMTWGNIPVCGACLQIHLPAVVR